MTTRTKVLFTILAGLAAGALGYWFVTHFERVPVEVRTGFRGEARRDDFLAARRLFESFSVPFEVIRSHRELPPVAATLLLLGRSDARFDPTPLVAWVERGGHLVVAAAGPERDPLLEALGVRVVRSKPPFEPTEVALGGGPPLAVRFRAPFALVPVGGAAPENGQGRHVLELARGAGRVVVLSDADFMRNRFIGNLDHAAFLWRLARDGRDGAVWLELGDAARSLWSVLLDRYWTAIVSAAVLLLVGLWTIGRRFGPPIPDAAPRRRRLRDHIAASGEFCWRHGAGRALHEAVRDSLNRSLEFRHPGWLAAGDLDQRLAQTSGLSPGEVREAFAPSRTLDAQRFTRAIATLERIRRSL